MGSNDRPFDTIGLQYNTTKWVNKQKIMRRLCIASGSINRNSSGNRVYLYLYSLYPLSENILHRKEEGTMDATLSQRLGETSNQALYSLNTNTKITLRYSVSTSYQKNHTNFKTRFPIVSQIV